MRSSRKSFALTSSTERFSAKKQLGQNFLVDPRIRQKIISACELNPSDTVLEIGPGLGVLTTEIVGRVKKFVAIETDLKLFHELSW